jgi:hypothetical protein
VGTRAILETSCLHKCRCLLNSFHLQSNLFKPMISHNLILVSHPIHKSYTNYFFYPIDRASRPNDQGLSHSFPKSEKPVFSKMSDFTSHLKREFDP